MRVKIPKKFYYLLPLFIKSEADKLNPYKPRIDYIIPFKKGLNGQDLPIPFGPLYSIFREELFVLKKILKDFIDKGYIRVSSSEAAIPILFIRKLGGGLRFYCDYRTLNAITRVNRYLLPFIRNTFRVFKGTK